jgi:PAS domain S-box-containing protein
MDVNRLSRQLDGVRRQMYQLILATVSAGSTNEHLDAALDKLTDDLEDLQVGERELGLHDNQINHTEESLQVERRRYQELFEFAPDAYLVTDCSGVIQEANQVAAALFQVDSERLTGLPLGALMGGENRLAFHDELARIRFQPDLNQITGWEFRMQPFGVASTLDVSLTVGILRDEEQRPTTLRWIIRDISPRKSAERALTAERDFAEKLIAAAPAEVLVLDREGRIVRFNGYLCELSGYPPEELLGRSWTELLVPPDEQGTARAWFDSILAGETDDLLGPLRTKSGALRIVKRSGKVLTETDGAVTRVLIVGVDVTEAQAAQERALRAERLAAIGEMVAGLAHESRNALQRGQACLEMLAKEVSDRPRALDLIDRLQSAQDHLHHLYEEVRHFAAPITLERRHCNLAAVWREAWARLELQHKSRKVAFREQANGPDIHCLADPFRLEQVFRNILDNALSACSDPVDIAIHCSMAEWADRETLEISIRDNGPGLTPEQRQKIFEPFFTTKVRGTGLGLAIAKRIVEAHGGRITASDRPAPGAEIVIALPKAPPEVAEYKRSLKELP